MLMADDPSDTDSLLNPQNPQQPKYARLKYLLQQTSAYSKFLADKLSKQDLADPQNMEHQTAGQNAQNVEHQTQTAQKEIFTQPALLTGGTLKPFQLAGVEWLVSLYENGLNGILADEMGLGKTVQCIAFLAFLFERGVSGPFLVVAPLSTLRNWVSEFERFAPSLPVSLLHGDTKRDVQAKLKGHPNTVIVTNYETVIRDAAHFRRHTWKYVVIDEGHRIKNINCRLVRELMRVRSLNRLLLTGTPLQNNLAELWSLLHFLLPDIFDDLASFESWFDTLRDSGMPRDSGMSREQQLEVISSLHDILKPFLLRRLKSDVLVGNGDRLPAKREFIVRCPPTALQSEMLRHLESGTLRDYLSAHCEDTKHQRLQGDTMQARKICNDPRLFEHSTARWSDSGKMIVFDQIVRLLAGEKRKVLVFSQMAKMLDILGEHLSTLGIRHVRIDGAVSEPDRQQAIRTFNADPACLVFLLTTRAGGLGLNLTAATCAIVYDPDWNPQADRQAADRLHRIGQRSAVTVLRLRVAGSVEEERMAVTAGRKERLERRVISRRRFKGRSEYLGLSVSSDDQEDHHGHHDRHDHHDHHDHHDQSTTLAIPTRSKLTPKELQSLCDPVQPEKHSDMLLPFHRHHDILDL